MKTDWTLVLPFLLLLGGYFLVRSAEEFSQGLGYALVVSACALQLRSVLKSINDHRKRQLTAS